MTHHEPPWTDALALTVLALALVISLAALTYLATLAGQALLG